MAAHHKPHFVLVERHPEMPRHERNQVFTVILDSTIDNQESGYTDLQIMKGFDPDQFPYCVARSERGLIVVDVKRLRTVLLLRVPGLQPSDPNQDPS